MSTGCRVDLSDVTISDAWPCNATVSGVVTGLSINGIDVTDFVEAELDRLHPERRLLAPVDPAGFRVAWQTIEQIARK